MFSPELMEYLLLGLIAVSAILIIIVIIQAVKISKIKKGYTQLMRGFKEENVEEILLKYIDKTEQLGRHLGAAEKEIQNLHQLVNKKSAKVSIERYNAYEDSGNDLSFSIALLNDHNDGFVITSLYNRHDQRVYAKPVAKGVSTYALSDEEKSVIAKAMQL